MHTHTQTHTTTLFLVCQEIIFSFNHVDSSVTVCHVLHRTNHRALHNATQTRNVNTQNAQDTSFR